MKLKDLAGWPPNRARVKRGSPDPTPSPEDYAKAILMRVYPLIPMEDYITLGVIRDAAKDEELIDLMVSNPKIREPIFRLLSDYTKSTIEEIGEIEIPF
jgi:hypothetical protein